METSDLNGAIGAAAAEAPVAAPRVRLGARTARTRAIDLVAAIATLPDLLQGEPDVAGAIAVFGTLTARLAAEVVEGLWTVEGLDRVIVPNHGPLIDAATSHVVYLVKQVASGTFGPLAPRHLQLDAYAFGVWFGERVVQLQGRLPSETACRAQIDLALRWRGPVV